MITRLLADILNHEIDSATTIVTYGDDGAHISNTWNSYITVADDDTLLIPVGGMIETEKNLNQNSKILLSISNRVLQGFNFPGTGVVVDGTGTILITGTEVDQIKETYSWIRGVLKIKVNSVKQTI